MSTRIYKVKTPTGDRLVEASTKSQAINHCVSTDYNAEPVLSSELYALIQAGHQVEKVMPTKKSDSPEPSNSPQLQDSLAGGISAATTPAIPAPASGNFIPPQGQLQQNASNPPAASTPPPLASSTASAPTSTGNQIPGGATPTPPGATSPLVSGAIPPVGVAVAPAPVAIPAATPNAGGVLAADAPRPPAAAFVPPPPAAATAKDVIAEQQRINPAAATVAGAPPQTAPAPIINRPAQEKDWEDRAQ